MSSEIFVGAYCRDMELPGYGTAGIWNCRDMELPKRSLLIIAVCNSSKPDDTLIQVLRTVKIFFLWRAKKDNKENIHHNHSLCNPPKIIISIQQ